MKCIKASIFFIFIYLHNVVAFARGYQSEVYGGGGGGGGIFFGYLTLLIILGLAIWGFLANREFRLNVIRYAVYLGSIFLIWKLFGKEWAMIACAVSIVLLLINDPAFKKTKDAKKEKKSDDIIEIKKPQSTQHQNIDKNKLISPFDNSSYPGRESNTQSSNKQPPQTLSQTALKSKGNVQLIQGNIKCCECGYQDLPKNFLASDVGDLYKKCPKCNMNWQVITAPSKFGQHKCTSCGLTGDKSAFFPSSVGKDYLLCPKCDTHS